MRHLSRKTRIARLVRALHPEVSGRFTEDEGSFTMKQDLTRMREHEATDGVTEEIGRLMRLVRRLELENASLRRELAATRPLAA